MCTTCGCGAGETRIEGQPVPAEHAGDPHWHVHADGTGHSHDHAHEHDGGHTHEHGNDHAHAHTHVHQHPDGSVHAHPHDHAGEHHHHHHAAHHEHPHQHADGSVHVHAHTHDDTSFHEHPHAHDHVHAPANFHGHEHAHRHADGSEHSHTHEHAGEHRHAHAETLDYGSGPARAHAPGMTQARMVQIERDILSKNDGYAAKNRQAFADRGLLALNFVSSPGSGKTTLLVRTIEALKARHAIAVIEGDQQTANDADRIRATGAPAVQINTGKGCHLDALMVGQALEKLAPRDESFLFIENVGNLVCPAAFDLGEAAKVAILSVTEGEDKPLKYPDMFAAASLMLLNKIDLLPHLDFKVELAIEAARRINPALEVIQVSATSGEGFAAWLAWLEAGLARTKTARAASLTALRRRVAELEAQLAAR